MKYLTLIQMLVFWIGSLNAQEVNIHFSFGTNLSYNLEDVRKITFEGDEMNLQLWDGSEYSWNVSTVNYYEYQGLVTNLEVFSLNNNSLNVKLFPNPVEELLNVLFQVSEADEFVLSLIDLSGKVLIVRNLGNKAPGDYLETIDLNEFPKGIYICKIGGKRTSAAQRIIKQ